MSRSHVRVAVFTATLVAPLLVATPASAASPRVSVVAEGLDSPRGVDVDRTGVTYVAESGTGGDTCWTEGTGEEAVETCFGTTARVTVVAPDGTVDRDAITGLPSISVHGEAVGASDVSVAADGTVFATVGLGANVSRRDALVAELDGDAATAAAALGTVVRIAADGSFEVVADLAAYEDAENPDGVTEDEEAGPDSNPDAVLAVDGTLYVADAGGNTVLAVDPDDGGIELAAVLPIVPTPAPPEVGGGEIPMQGVPTSLSVAADGRILVGQLTGFPFPVGGARVYALTDDPAGPAVVDDGFTTIVDVADLRGERYVLELARDGLLSGDLTGALVRVRADGSRAELLADALRFPGGMGVTPTGALHISNGAVFPGGGQLLAFDTAPPADAAIDLACPPGAVPRATLADVAGSVHQDAVDCTVWHGVFRGFEDGTFRPSTPITRAQFASTVARVVDATGTALPADGPGFPDVRPGSTHEAAIVSLAAADVVEGFGDGTYRPGRPITRAQATSLLARAYAHVTGGALPAGPDAWRDDDGSVHEDAIDAATRAGWIQGARGGGFAPQRDITRGQVASVLARMASTLVADGALELPTG